MFFQTPALILHKEKLILIVVRRKSAHRGGCGLSERSKAKKEPSYRPLPFVPEKLAAVTLSHAHAEQALRNQFDADTHTRMTALEIQRDFPLPAMTCSLGPKMIMIISSSISLHQRHINPRMHVSHQVCCRMSLKAARCSQQKFVKSKPYRVSR